jgi:cyclase
MVAANQGGQPDITVGNHAELYIGGKAVEIHKVGRAHTDGDVVVLFPQHRVLAAGDIFANGPGTSAQLVDYGGGGSAKNWPNAIGDALQLEFDTVVPGHGLVSTRQDLADYRQRATRFAATIQQLVSQGKTRADIEKVVRADYAWEDFHIMLALDGLIAEFR